MGSKYLPSFDTPVPCHPGKKWHHQQITGVIMMGTIYSVLYPSHYLKSINIIRELRKSPPLVTPCVSPIKIQISASRYRSSYEPLL